MLEEVKKVLAGIRKDTEKVIRRLTENHLRCERYDVTTAPNGTVIGVTQPFGTEELLIPYSWMCSNAQVGDTVIVVWWSGLSNAQAWFMGDGWVSRLLSITSGGGGITVNGTLSTTGNATIGGNLSVSGNENVNGNFTVLGNAMGRVMGLGQARAEIPANADLNDYVEPGVYGIGNNSIAASLANCPSAYAGTLRVWNANGGASNPGESWYYVVQEYNDFYGDSWRRSGQSGSGTSVTWGDWFKSLNSSDKRLGSGTDLDDYKTTGFYGITSGALNSPQNWTWLMVIGAAGGVVQVVFAQNKIMIRAYTGYPLAWTAWKSVSLS